MALVRAALFGAVLVSAALTGAALSTPVRAAAPEAAAASGAAAAHAAGPLAQGLALLAKGRSADARPLIEAGLKTSPDDLEGLVAIVQIYLGQEDYERALPPAQHAVAVAPGSSKAHYWLGRVLGEKAAKISKLRAAFLVDDIKREFEKAVALDPKNLDAREAMVMFYKEVPGVMGGSTAKARAEAEAIVAYDAARGLGMLAQVEAEQGTEATFMEIMNRLAKVDPGKACIGRAQYHANTKKDVDRAAAELAKMPQISPKSAPDLTQAAAMLQQLNKWDEALAMLDKALVIDPGYAPATYQIGRACLLSKKDMARAESAFKAYIAAEPAQDQPPRAAARWRLSQVYQETGRIADARRELEQALRDSPNNQEYRKSLAALKAK